MQWSGYYVSCTVHKCGSKVSTMQKPPLTLKVMKGDQSGIKTIKEESSITLSDDEA